MLAIIEKVVGDVEKATGTERRIIEEFRQMGNEVLHSCARRPTSARASVILAAPRAKAIVSKRRDAPRDISDAEVERLLTLTVEKHPRDATRWSTRCMVKRSGLSRAR